MDEKIKMIREDFPIKCSDDINIAFNLDVKFNVAIKAMMKGLMQASMEEAVNPWDVVDAEFSGFKELNRELSKDGLTMAHTKATGCLNITKIK